MEKKNGFVVLLDYLGVGNYSIEKCCEFLKKRKEIQNDFHGIEDIFRHVSENNLMKLNDYDVKNRLFGDSILITFSKKTQEAMQEEEIFSINYNFINPIVSRIVANSLNYKMMVRGSIAYGDFIQEDPAEKNDITVIGPAVADAARNYEMGNWMGVHYTPNTSMIIDRYLQRNTSEKFDSRITKYMIPSKTNQMNLYCVNWVKSFFAECSAKEEDKNPRDLFYEILNKMEKNGACADKYFNTLSYFKDVFGVSWEELKRNDYSVFQEYVKKIEKMEDFNNK